MTPGREDTAVDVTLVGSSEHRDRRRVGDRQRGRRCPPRRRPASRRRSSSAPKLAERLDLVPGSPLRIRVASAAARPRCRSLDCRVAGIGAFQFEAEDDYTVATTMTGFEAAHGSADGDDEADLVLVASAPGVAPEAAAKAIAALRPDLRAYSNAQVVEQFNERAFTYFRQISVVLSSMTLAFAFLLVATLLTMSVNQRLGEVAALRALGFPRRRIAANLLCESALLVGVGGAAALPLGGLLAVVLDRILRSMPGLPERLHFFVFEPRTVLLHAALLARHRQFWRRCTRSGWRRGCRSRRRCGGRSCRDRGHADRRRARPDAPVSDAGRRRHRARRRVDPDRQRASTSRSPGRPAAASRRCCTCSAASISRPPARCCSKGATSARCPSASAAASA